jgi:hypothetical protein
MLPTTSLLELEIMKEAAMTPTSPTSGSATIVGFPAATSLVNLSDNS